MVLPRDFHVGTRGRERLSKDEAEKREAVNGLFPAEQKKAAQENEDDSKGERKMEQGSWFHLSQMLAYPGPALGLAVSANFSGPRISLLASACLG